jgi:NAD-dependent SIR2 family protein deacetylase
VTRVFILGAGFSKDAGLPLASELTAIVLKRFEASGPRIRSVLEQAENHLRQMGSSTEPVEFEEFFDSLRYYAQIARMREWEVDRSAGDGDGPREAAELVEGLEPRLLETALKAIEEHQQSAGVRKQYVEAFAGMLTRSDTVITFNYDTLLEQALRSIGRSFSLGFSDSTPLGPKILKLHGSLDWVSCEPAWEDTKWTRLWAPPSGTRILAATGGGVALSSVQSHRAQGETAPGVAGLGSFKPVEKVPGLSILWRAAVAAIKQARELFVVGYSLPVSDGLARLHVRVAIREREVSALRVTIVDPGLAKRSAAMRKRALSWFDSVKATELPQTAAQTDWRALLT